MEAGDVTVPEMPVPHGFVDHKLDDRSSVVMAPSVAAGIRLVLLITHDGMNDLTVVQDEVDVVANLAECGGAGNDIAAVDFSKAVPAPFCLAQSAGELQNKTADTDVYRPLDPPENGMENYGRYIETDSHYQAFSSLLYPPALMRISGCENLPMPLKT